MTEESSEERLQRSLELAYAHLNRRDRTVAEVRSHLERKGISAELIERCLQTLGEQRLVDDARYAELFVTDKRELEQWGSERIRRGLLTRGIDREIVERALTVTGAGDGDAEEPTELQRAVTVLRRRYPAAPSDRRERERALGVLLRKGYESEIAVDALAAFARDG